MAILLAPAAPLTAQEAPEPSHGVAMHGAPALAADFASLPYADPAAPQGGAIVVGEVGSFDSLNPFLPTGRAPWQLSFTVYESLMARSWDEPFTLYGLIAATIATPEDRSFVEFTLRPEARFSNGAPITPEDVLWTWETLRDKGKLSLRGYYDQVASAEKVGAHGVRFTFKAPNRELPLLLGLMPILPKDLYAERDFEGDVLATPIGSGPYVVERVEPGGRVRYRRDPDYWGADLAVNAGRHNFETIDVVYFSSQAILFEAFSAGSVDIYPDLDPAHWTDAYDLPRVADGRIIRAEIPHQRPSGMHGFVFNTRRALFADRRVREALALAFDFAWVNERFFRTGYTRILSTFSGSPLGFSGPATGEEAALLAPFAADLPEGALEAGWTPPEGAGDGRNRGNLRRARALLEAAGWSLVDGVLTNAQGVPFAFEILVASEEQERLSRVFVDALKPLGVQASVRLVDSAQYRARIGEYDYDMMIRRWIVSLSPGEEQRFYWGSEGRETPQTRNYMGADAPAIDAMIDALLAATSRESFEAAARALDRVLASEIYVVPFGYLETDRVAHSRAVARPERSALYGHVFIDVWWRAGE